MSVQPILGAALLATALPVAFAAAGAKRPADAVVSENLRRGLATPDARRATLARSSTDRLVAPAIAGLARRARRFTPAGMLDRLEARLLASGLQRSWPLERVLAAKLVLCLMGIALGLLHLVASPGLFSFLLVAGAAALGWFAPDAVIAGRVDERRKGIQRQLPDTMDQITIAVEAGLGFEAAVARVAANSETELSMELRRMLQDVQLGMARVEALDGLASRVDLADLRQFVTAIRQAERYGLPVANVLRVQSGELREKRRQRAEERAMKLPVKVLFPLIFCILPSLFIVIIGPGVIRFTHSGLFH